MHRAKHTTHRVMLHPITAILAAILNHMFNTEAVTN